MAEVPRGEVARWLVAAGAQRDVSDWAARHAPTWNAFWEGCPRGDWLLAVAARVGIERERIVRATLACVPVLDPYLPQQETMIDRAVDLVRQTSDPTDARCVRARAELDELLARCDDPSAHAAVLAVQALLATLEDSAAAAALVAFTVQAATMDAGDCGMMHAARYTEHECARLVRESISTAVFVDAVENAQIRSRVDQGSL